MPTPLKITVLLGGVSAERDVSLSSGLRIAAALREKGHEVICLDPAEGVLTRETERGLLATGVGSAPPSLAALAGMAAQSLSPTLGTLPEVTEADCVFLALHGGQGEDGTVQALLDMVGVPYTGSGHLASALAMDKHLSKVVLRAAGVATANWMMAPTDGSVLDPHEVGRHLDWPVVVKPSKQGSTVGLSIVREPEALAAAVTEAFKYDDEVMVERFVPGQELTVGILGDQVLPTIEIVPMKELYDYECKYTPGMAKEFVAELSDEVQSKLADQARKAFDALKLGGYARIDFRLDPQGQPWCLEANTLPGMTPTSLIPQAAAAAGVLFPDLCERIVNLALAKQRDR
ncbi:D-alanine--D-alanine ligase family protein [Gemmatimonas phototrophica]|uniref:D-alanine--D-alanine ligase n=1 Tax=Gemmatimonas phototrophica TaxID=1379270 RepID=A0A143BMT3_9BACT|nr:D-alanine--D-alanine ligase [Gemmatimonas phototrophica]AMW06377.1 D-alanine--D-alanine ligase [Gemmatimonas phototrophica]